MDNNRLKQITNQSIQQGLNNRRQKKRKEWMGVGIVCVMFFSTMLTNESFARQIAEIPIIGNVANIFLKQEVREYEMEYEIDVNIPQLKSLNENLDQQVNQYILDYINEKVDEVKQTAHREYEAFIHAGGKKENFMPGNVTIRYRVTCNNDQYLSFFLMSHTIHASSYTELQSYTIDLKTGKKLTLENIYGKNYQQLLSQEIERQIKSQDVSVFNVEIFDFIDEQRPFYLNEHGEVVVMFEKYELTAGSYGELSFVIPKEVNNEF